MNVTNLKNRAGLACALALGLLGAASSARAQDTYYNDYVTITEGTYKSGSTGALNAADGTSYAITSQTEAGTGSQVAAFVARFPVPIDANYCMMTFNARLSLADGSAATGSFVQVYLRKSGLSDLYLGSQYTDNGVANAYITASADQVQQYRDSGGKLQAIFRAVRQTSAGTGTMTLTTDRFQPLEGGLFPTAFTKGARVNYAVPYSIGTTQYLRYVSLAGYDLSDVPSDVFQFLSNYNPQYWSFQKDFTSEPNVFDNKLGISTNRVPAGQNGLRGTQQLTADLSGKWGQHQYASSVVTPDNGKPYWIVVVKRGIHGLQLLSHSGTPSYYGLGSGGEDDQNTNQTSAPYAGKYVHVVDSIEDDLKGSSPTLAQPVKYYIMFCHYSYDPSSPYIGVDIMDAAEVSGLITGSQVTTIPAP